MIRPDDLILRRHMNGWSIIEDTGHERVFEDLDGPHDSLSRAMLDAYPFLRSDDEPEPEPDDDGATGE